VSVAIRGKAIWVANEGGNSLTEVNGVNGSLVRVVNNPSMRSSRPSDWLSTSRSLVSAASGNGLNELNSSTVRIVSHREISSPRRGISLSMVAPVGRQRQRDSVTELNVATVGS